MEQKEINLVTIVAKIKRNKKTLLRWGAYGLAAGLVIALSIPRQYTANVKIALESKSQRSGSSSLGGLASMMGVDIGGGSTGGIGEAVYPEILKSSPFLYEFVQLRVPYKESQTTTLGQYLMEEQKSAWWSYVSPGALFGLFSSEEPSDTLSSTPAFRPTPKQKAFEMALSGSIQAVEEKKSGLLEIKVQMQDPVIAAVVADSVVVKLQRYMANYYTSKARYDLQQREVIFAKARQDYHEANYAYASIQDQNQSLVSQAAKTKIERYKNERDVAYMVYQQLASDVEAARIKLEQDTPIATVVEPARVPLNPSAPNRKIIVIGLTLLALCGRIAVLGIQSLFRR